MDAKMIEMLACYVNQTLPEDQRREVEKQLEADPACRKQLAFFEALQTDIRNSVPPTPPDLGLEQVLARIRQERAKKAGKDEKPRNRFVQLLRTLAQPKFAYSLGAAVIMLQGGAISFLALHQNEMYSETRAAGTYQPIAGPFIKVSFKPEIKESDIRFLLVGLGASIVGGPSQLGDYYLYLEPKRTDWAAQQLRMSQIVDSVNVIATLPVAKD